MAISFTDASWRLTFAVDAGLDCGCPACLDGGYCGQTYGIALGDVDGDGWLDLFANHHLVAPSEILYGFGKGSRPVSPVTLAVDGDEHGAVFFDIDRDGDLDLIQGVGAGTGSVANPDNPEFWNQVLLNRGGTISPDNQADELGLDYGPSRTRILVPLEIDGKTGIMIGNVARPDGAWPAVILLQKPNGSFRVWDDSPARAGDNFGIGARLTANDATDFVFANGASLRIIERDGDKTRKAPVDVDRMAIVTEVVIADFDGDLDPEIFVGQFGANPDKLLVRKGSGTWVDRAEASGLGGVTTQTVSAVAGDFDNDGDQDIAALQLVDGLQIVFWINDGNGNFRSRTLTDATVPGAGQSMVVGDVNNDGMLDLVISTGDGALTEENAGGYVLLEGDPTRNGWLSFELEGAAETTALGSRVYIQTPDGRRQMLEQDSGAHRWAQDDTRLHFGLGDAERAMTHVVWADGDRQWTGLERADQRLKIRENPAESLLLSGKRGDDSLEGRKGDDILLGRGGADTLKGKAGSDLLKGGPGADVLLGGGGADELRGGSGADLLKGGKGSDILRGGRGADRLEGGGGADVFEFGRGDGRKNIVRDMTDGTDMIRIVRGADDFGDLRLVQRGDDARLTFANVKVLLLDVDPTALTADDFFFG